MGTSAVIGGVIGPESNHHIITLLGCSRSCEFGLWWFLLVYCIVLLRIGRELLFSFFFALMHALASFRFVS